MKNAQLGAAIVLAMGVVVLATLAATAILTAQSTWSRQIDLGANHAQARLLVPAGLDWARAVLSDDRRAGNVDHNGEAWALPLPLGSVDNGSLTGQIEDQQGRFNLNSLLIDGRANPAQLARFRRLLALLDLPSALAGALVDWIDADSEPQPHGGAEDAHYLAQQPPYLAANQPLADVAELALVHGFDDGVRERLRPFVTALPGVTAINVNTASPEVLAAVIDGLELDDARVLVARRHRDPFRSTADFLRELPRDMGLPADSISVSSDYFIATTRITLGAAQARGSALLVRAGAGWPVVIWRKIP